MHWEYVEFEAKYSWIGVDGLPLNLWNLDTFKLIGEACGGLLEVSKETVDQSFLRFAKLKVKGQQNGFLDPIVEIPCEDVIIHVGLFSLGLNKITDSHCSSITRGILARIVKGDNHGVHVRGTGLGMEARKEEDDDVDEDTKEMSLTEGDTSFSGGCF